MDNEYVKIVVFKFKIQMGFPNGVQVIEAVEVT